MKIRKVITNAFTTTAQEFGSAAVLFLLYRYLYRAIGAEGLGIWSLVLASTSVITLANQGFSSSVVKFVAKYAAREQADEVSILIQTAFLSISGGLAIACLALYPAAVWILKLVVPQEHLETAIAIAPWALLSLWINVGSDVLLAGLAGHELILQRNYVIFGGCLLNLVLALQFVPRFGLLGLAYAQTIEAAGSFLVTWLLLRRQIPQFPFVPRHWNRARFREMIGYGAEFQLITICQAAREPVTKALLTRFAGLAATGFYDMASRWVVTFRELIVQANQVLVPTVAALQERDPDSILRVYRDSYRLILYLSVPSFAFLLAVSPVVSVVWLGSYQPMFVCFVALLTVGWLANILGNPAYVVDLGTGALRRITAGCLTTCILNFALGLAGGKFFGGTGVVAASAFSLMLGYALILIQFHRENRLPFSVLLPRESLKIILSSILAGLLLFPYLRRVTVIIPFSRGTAGLLLGVLLIAILIPMWAHPLRRRVWRWALSRSSA